MPKFIALMKDWQLICRDTVSPLLKTKQILCKRIWICVDNKFLDFENNICNQINYYLFLMFVNLGSVGAPDMFLIKLYAIRCVSLCLLCLLMFLPFCYDICVSGMCLSVCLCVCLFIKA